MFPNEMADRCSAGDVTANGMRVDAGCAGGQGWRGRVLGEPDEAEGALAECADEDVGGEGCRGGGREGRRVGSVAQSDSASVAGATAGGRGVEKSALVEIGWVIVDLVSRREKTVWKRERADS